MRNMGRKRTINEEENLCSDLRWIKNRVKYGLRNRRPMDGSGVDIHPSIPSAQSTAHQTLTRLLGRITAWEGVLIFSTAKRVLSPPCIDRSVNYNQ